MSKDHQEAFPLVKKAQEFLNRAKKNFHSTDINDNEPPSGYIDLFVYSLKEGENFEFPNKFIYVDGMSSLLEAAREACSGGKKSSIC